MSINGSSVNVDGTISVSGGTSTDLALTGGPALNELLTYLDDSSEFILRKSLLFSVVQPRVLASAPNGYTQRRSKLVVQSPLALDNGNYTTNQIAVAAQFDVETTSAEAATLIGIAAQCLYGSAFADFWAEQRVE